MKPYFYIIQILSLTEVYCVFSLDSLRSLNVTLENVRSYKVLNVIHYIRKSQPVNINNK